MILGDVQSSEPGWYEVIVTSPYGSVTSSLANLIVSSPPFSAHLISGGVHLEFSGVAGSNYVLQSATSLVSPLIWVSIFTNAADATGNWGFTDTNVLSSPARFFRIAVP